MMSLLVKGKKKSKLVGKKGRMIKLAKKKTTKPTNARFNPSQVRMMTNKIIYNRLKQINETKLLSLQKYNVGSSQISPTSDTYWRGFVLGPSAPVGWTDPNWLPLQGIGTIQGTSAQQRLGNYVYFNQTTMPMLLERQIGNRGASPIEFRLIVFKSRRATDPEGVSKNPGTSLFINSLGAPEGHETIGVDGKEIMFQPLNKRDWVIFRDQQFILSPSQSIPVSTQTATGFHPKYACMKRFRIDLKHNIKCRIPPNPDPSAQSYPINYDYSYGVVLYARPVGNGAPGAQDWNVSVTGTTSFTDS